MKSTRKKNTAEILKILSHEAHLEPVAVSHSPKTIHPALSFFGSFLVMVGFVLGVYWFGNQLYKSITVIFRAPLTGSFPVFQTTSHFDPLHLVEAVKQKNTDMLFLDVRSSEEYKKEHVRDAVSLPVYSFENDAMRYGDIQDLLDNFKGAKSKRIIVYGPSTSFQMQQEVVKELNKRGYSAQLLAIGWNELRHFQNVWLPEPMWGKLDSSIFTKGDE